METDKIIEKMRKLRQTLPIEIIEEIKTNVSKFQFIGPTFDEYVANLVRGYSQLYYLPYNNKRYIRVGLGSLMHNRIKKTDDKPNIFPRTTSKRPLNIHASGIPASGRIKCTIVDGRKGINREPEGFGFIRVDVKMNYPSFRVIYDNNSINEFVANTGNIYRESIRNKIS